jgi:glycosyltransferase involved in cell wall biosynthesis
MRVLILHSRYLSGDASGENRVVRDEAKLLADGGHAVRVYDPSPTRAHGMRLITTAIDAVWSMEGSKVARDLIRGFRPDIVHCHNLFPMLSPAVVRTCHSEGIPVVITMHNYRLMCLPSTFLRDGRVCEDCIGRAPWPGVIHRCYRQSLPGSATIATSLLLHRSLRTFEYVSLFLAVSPFVREKHIEAGLRADRIRVKSNFTWSVPRREGTGRNFLYLGRLSPEKGVTTLVRAWADVGADLVVVGDGPDADELRAEAPSSVRFAGPLPGDDVVDLIREARAVLVPSVWYEAQPRVILEAYAAGVPVIASRIGGLPDLITEGESGLLVAPGDRTAWAEAANRLLNDEEAVLFGEGAYRLWQERFSPARGLVALEEVYREAVP